MTSVSIVSVLCACLNSASAVLDPALGEKTTISPKKPRKIVVFSPSPRLTPCYLDSEMAFKERIGLFQHMDSAFPVPASSQGVMTIDQDICLIEVTSVIGIQIKFLIFIPRSHKLKRTAKK